MYDGGHGGGSREVLGSFNNRFRISLSKYPKELYAEDIRDQMRNADEKCADEKYAAHAQESHPTITRFANSSRLEMQVDRKLIRLVPSEMT